MAWVEFHCAVLQIVKLECFTVGTQDSLPVVKNELDVDDFVQIQTVRRLQSELLDLAVMRHDVVEEGVLVAVDCHDLLPLLQVFEVNDLLRLLKPINFFPASLDFAEVFCALASPPNDLLPLDAINVDGAGLPSNYNAGVVLAEAQVRHGKNFFVFQSA